MARNVLQCFLTILVFASPVAFAAAAEDHGMSKLDAALALPVSLTGESKSRRETLADVCRQAGVALEFDTAALTDAGLDLDEKLELKVTAEPLTSVIGLIAGWSDHPGICREVRGGVLILTTIPALQQRTLEQLPDWLKPLYTKGLIANVDDSGSVTAITAGPVMTDDLLARLETLPKLRELHIEVTDAITPGGLAHLARFNALEKLTLYEVNQKGMGLGNDAISSVVALKSLRELNISECGTTDEGARLLESMQQLTHLKLYQEGRLTDAALVSLARLKHLKHLDLTSHGGTERLGRMTFTQQALKHLTALQELESLGLIGHPLPADFFVFPKLISLSVADVDDVMAAQIARCQSLQSLVLLRAAITDDGLKQIASLKGLRRLNLRSDYVTDAGTAHLKRLSGLRQLELGPCRVSDETLKHIAEIETLERLDLHGSGNRRGHLGESYTVEGLLQLKALPHLRTLWLNSVALSGDYGDLAQLTQLRQLSFFMANISDGELDALEDALPHTTIHVMSGGRQRLPKSMRAARK